MNKGAKGILAYSLLAIVATIVVALFAGAVMAYSAGNSSVSINYALITQDIAGRHYTPTCLGTCDLVFSLSYSGINAPSSAAVDTNKLRTQFNWAKGQDKFQKSEIYYLNEYQEEVKDYSTVCLQYNTTEGFEGNWTYSSFSNCTQVESGSHLENRQGWKELTKEITFEKGKTYYIDIRGYFKINTQGGFKVDVIPLVKIAASDFMLSEMAWWTGGADWANSKNITMTHVENNYHGNEYIRVNITGLTLATNNCSKELVLIDNSSYQLEMGVINSGTSDGKKWCYVEFLANISANENLNYTAYYNNPTANEQMENLTYFMDDFNRADSTDIGNGWAKPPAQTSTDSKILNNELVYIVGSEPAGAFHGVSISSAIPHTIESTGNLTVSKRYAGFYLSDRNTTSAGYTGTYIHWNSGPSTADSDDYIKLQDEGFANQSANGMTILTNAAYVFYTSINNQDAIGRRTSGKVVRQDNGAFFSYKILSNAVTTDTLSIGVLNIQGHADAVGATMATDYIKVYKGIVYLNSSTYTIGAEQTAPNTAPFIQNITIAPATAYTNSTLNCSANYGDADSDKGNVSITWYNGTSLHETTTKLDIMNGSMISDTPPAGIQAKGEIWNCTINATDSRGGVGLPNSKTITIKNTLSTHSQPRLQATTKYNTTSDNLTCYNQSTQDADNDAVTNIYNWYKNSQPLTVLNMPFENSARDYSTYNNTGTIYGASFTSGKIGKALSFDGVDDYIQTSSFVNVGNEITLSAWIYTANTTGPDRNIIGIKRVGGGWLYGIVVYYGNLAGAIYGSSNGLSCANPTVGGGVLSLPLNTWTHVAMTFNNATNQAKFYKNGELGQTVTWYSCGGASEKVEIASIIHNWFDGTIDEVRISPYALTAEQIKQRYEETKDGKTDNSTIVAQETTAGETYICQVTPNDGEEDGVALNSSSLLVMPPVYNITFNVTDSLTGFQLPGLVSSIECNNSFSVYYLPNPAGPYTFYEGSYECTFTKMGRYNTTQIFVADSDKTVIIPMSEQKQLTTEEHTWLEALYQCVINGDCTAFRLWEDTNQTVSEIWKKVTKTDRSVITQENIISNTLNSSSNITINYTIQIPFKIGYSDGELLPLRMFFWFHDGTNCYNQDKITESNRAETPYCFPLIAETLGPNNGSVAFRVDLRPNLPVGNYNITRTIEIDPVLEGVRRWINYGQEIIGTITVLESGDASVNLFKDGSNKIGEYGEKVGAESRITGGAIYNLKDLISNPSFFFGVIVTLLVLSVIVNIWLTSRIKKKVFL